MQRKMLSDIHARKSLLVHGADLFFVAKPKIILLGIMLPLNADFVPSGPRTGARNRSPYACRAPKSMTIDAMIHFAFHYNSNENDLILKILIHFCTFSFTPFDAVSFYHISSCHCVNLALHSVSLRVVAENAPLSRTKSTVRIIESENLI